MNREQRKQVERILESMGIRTIDNYYSEDNIQFEVIEVTEEEFNKMPEIKYFSELTESEQRLLGD